MPCTCFARAFPVPARVLCLQLVTVDILNCVEFPNPINNRGGRAPVFNQAIGLSPKVLNYWTWYNWQSNQQGSRLVGVLIGSTHRNERPDAVRRYSLGTRCILI